MIFERNRMRDTKIVSYRGFFSFFFSFQRNNARAKSKNGTKEIAANELASPEGPVSGGEVAVGAEVGAEVGAGGAPVGSVVGGGVTNATWVATAVPSPMDPMLPRSNEEASAKETALLGFKVIRTSLARLDPVSMLISVSGTPVRPETLVLTAAALVTETSKLTLKTISELLAHAELVVATKLSKVQVADVAVGDSVCIAK
jgi:hypothetical protein